MAEQAVRRPQALSHKVAHKSRALLRAVSEGPVWRLKLSHALAGEEKKRFLHLATMECEEKP